MTSYAIGVDLGGTTTKIGIFNTNGEIIKKWEIRTRIENSGKFILQDISTSIKEKVTELDFKLLNLLGVGIGVPGPVLDGGIVNRCVNLGFPVFNIEKEFSELLGGVKVKAANDANVAALGEMWKGGGSGFKNLVLVTLGTGVGGGIILDQKILNGTFGAAGELGHIQVEAEEDEKCACGKKGCLEQYASATGLLRYYKKLSKNDNLNELTAKDIFDLAKENDLFAIKAIDNLCHNLGRALSYVSCVIDPEVYVIGGGVSRAGNKLIENIKNYYVQTAFHASKDVEFRLATLGNDAGMFGAVKLVL